MKKLPIMILLSVVLSNQPCWADSLSDGIAAFKKGNYNAAVKSLLLRIKKAPNDAVAHYYLASAYNRANENALALAQYKYCLSLDNNKQVVADAKIAITNLKMPVRKKLAVATTTASTTPATATPATTNSASYSDQLEALTDKLMQEKHGAYLKEEQGNLDRMFAQIDKQTDQNIYNLGNMDSMPVAPNVRVNPNIDAIEVTAQQRVRDAGDRKKQWYQDQFDREKEMLRNEERLNAAEILRRDPNWTPANQ